MADERIRAALAERGIQPPTPSERQPEKAA
jgi:hypothetical protein